MPAPARLAIVVFVFGLGSAAANAQRTPPGPLPPEVLEDTMKRASLAVEPPAYSWTVPFVGAIGVLIGGRIAGKQATPSQSPEA